MIIYTLSHSSDPHISAINKYLQKKFNLENFTTNKRSKIDLSYNLNSSEAMFLLDHHNIDYKNIISIWVRKPFWELVIKHKSQEASLNWEYSVREEMEQFNSFLQVCREKNIFILCDPMFVSQAKNKYNQLNYANKLGVKTPDTISSRNRTILNKFISEHSGKCVIKSLITSPVYYGDQRLAFSLKKFSNIDLSKFFNKRLKNQYPLVLQEEIIKKFELRITVIGSQIFACKIDSQKFEETKLNLKERDPFKIPHEYFELPETIKTFCFNLCKKLNIQYGAIDMAVTDDNKYVFFEINPAGQYLWIEKMTGIPLSEAMANLLMYPEKYKLH